MNPQYRLTPELTEKPSASIGSFLRRSAVRRNRPGKPRRGPERDEKYRNFIRGLGCIVCRDTVPHNPQSSKTECAHIGERGLGQKCSDYETVPLCSYHHRIGPTSHHVLGKHFWSRHGIDRDRTIAALRAVYDINFEGETNK